MRSILNLAMMTMLVAAAPAPADSVGDPVFPAALRARLDRPRSTARTFVPPREPGSPHGAVRCFRYPAFLVKEVDYGEHGDDHVSVAPLAAGTGVPACGLAPLPGEMVLTSSEESYFLGASGRYGFVLSTEGGDGTPVTIHDLAVGRSVYADTMDVDADPPAIASTRGGLRVSYRRVASGTCAIPAGGAACWQAFANQAQLPPEVARRPAPVALCIAGYRAARAARTEPSALIYRVTLMIDAGGAQTVQAGDFIACRPQS